MNGIVGPACFCLIPGRFADVFPESFSRGGIKCDDTGVRLWVVGEAPGEITADSLSALFAAAGVESLSADEAPEAGRGSVAYLLPSGRPYGERLTSRGVLTIAAIPPSDTPSPVVIGLTLVEGKPKIVVSRSALESSGHKLSAKLLRICSLVE